MTTPSPDAEATARVESDARFTPGYGAQEAQFAPGSMIAGRYRIAGILGKGGMGEVYRADDVKLGQTVALKFLPARLARDKTLLEHLHDEVRHGRQVSHPNVCRIYDIGEADGAHFVAMEYVDGEDLSKLLRRIGRLADDKAVDIARGIAAGLMAAHAKGILHRDLKPANVMIDSHGDARITDFGLALSATDDRNGEFAGTPAYMAPELLQGEPATVQSDLYALGLVMYELFTGHRAHTGKTLPDRMRDLTSDITVPSNHVRNIDPAVERVILRCLSNDASQRPRSARAVVEALPGGDPLAAAMAAGETPSPRIVAAAGTEGTLRRSVAWSLLGAATLLLSGVIVLSRMQSRSQTISFERSPEVLFDRAQTIAKELGVAANGMAVRRIYERDGYVDWLAKRNGGRVLTPIGNGPGPVLFRAEFGISPDEAEREPELATAPGRTKIDVDSLGRLSFLLAAPINGDQPARSADWNKLLDLAGLLAATLTPVPPNHAPPVPFDERAAWNGTFAGSNTPVRVEAASWRGMPVYFRVSGDWERSPGLGEIPRPAIFAYSVSFAMLAVTTVLAWRNFRRRRGDRNGALRVAAVFFLLAAVGAILVTTYPSNPFGFIGAVFSDLAGSFGFGALAYVMYLAIEPYLRQRWGDRLIAWSRLIAGRVQDPMVGRDTLIGVVGGLTFAFLAYATPFMSVWLGRGDRALAFHHTRVLLGIPQAIGVVFGAFINGIVIAFLTMTVLVVATIVLRNRIAAGALLFVVISSVFLASASTPIPVSICIAALLTFVSYRYGLLASAVMYTVHVQLFLHPTLAVAWATRLTAIVYVTVAALAIWAFRTSLGGESPFADSLDA